jgi:hypothetical protein
MLSPGERSGKSALAGSTKHSECNSARNFHIAAARLDEASSTSREGMLGARLFSFP